jgi:hypothetical protein
MFNRSPLFFFSCLHLSNKKGTPRGKIWKEKLLRREVTSFYHFVLIHPKPFEETDKDFIAQQAGVRRVLTCHSFATHMSSSSYSMLRPQWCQRLRSFPRELFGNIYLRSYPWTPFGTYSSVYFLFNHLGLKGGLCYILKRWISLGCAYMHLHMRLRMKMNALHSMRMNYQ